MDSDIHSFSHLDDTNAQISGGWNFGDLVSTLGEAFFHHDSSGGHVFGTPREDSKAFEHQTTGFTCDVVSQEMILHEYGVNATEAQLVYDATSHGWLNEGGTSIGDMGRLLDLHGVPNHEIYGGTVDSLVSELAHGHKLIVAVDSSNLWESGNPLFSLFHSPQADHAIVVTGLDMSDLAHPKVVVNDPGLPDGGGNVYPLDQFLEAWHASGNAYVATDFPPPNLADNSILGTHFNAASSMYMDTGFWQDFLSKLVSIIDHGVSSKSGGGGSFGDQSASIPNPWEKMTSSDRNDLFLDI